MPARGGGIRMDGRGAVLVNRKEGRDKSTLGSWLQRFAGDNRRLGRCAVMDGVATTGAMGKGGLARFSRPEATERAGSFKARCGGPIPSSGAVPAATKAGKGGKTVTCDHAVGAQRQRSQPVCSSGSRLRRQRRQPQARARSSCREISWPSPGDAQPARASGPKCRPAADVGIRCVESLRARERPGRPHGHGFRQAQAVPGRQGEAHRERFFRQLPPANQQQQVKPGRRGRASCRYGRRSAGLTSSQAAASPTI